METEITKLVLFLGSEYAIRIEQWRNDGEGNRINNGSWRVGLNWFSEDKYDFICEKPSLLEALNCCVDEYVNKK